MEFCLPFGAGTLSDVCFPRWLFLWQENMEPGDLRECPEASEGGGEA